MAHGIRWVGLDVHAHESTFAIFDDETGEVITKRVAGRPHELLPWLRGVARPARAVYEAGPTGYGLARRESSWSCARRGEPTLLQPIGSRPISAMRSVSPGAWRRGS